MIHISLEMFFWLLWAATVLLGGLGFLCGRMDRADRHWQREHEKEE